MGWQFYDHGYDLALDENGNLYATGSFDYNIFAGTYLPPSAGGADIFISKLDGNGNFMWTKGMGGALNDFGYRIGLDASGNIYIMGTFYGVADFDPGPGVHNLISAGEKDVFIAKLDNNGDFIWAKSIGGADNDSGYGLALDTAGNIYTIGTFIGTADFDPGPGLFNLIGAGEIDTFISKLDGSGDFVWAKGVSGALDEDGRAIALDAQANVYLTGYFRGTADFDPGPSEFHLTSVGAGGVDVFIAKLGNDGSFIWAKRIGGLDFDYGNRIALDASGNVYTMGDFRGTADFDPSGGIFNLTSAGETDTFISKLDSHGNFIWAKCLSGISYQSGSEIALDADSSVYVIGSFSGTADFDPGPGIFNLTSVGSSDTFISKLDNNGKFFWAKRMGGTDYLGAADLQVDVDRNIYLVGGFEGYGDFDPNEGSYRLLSHGSSDIFVTKFKYAIFGDVPDTYWAWIFIEQLYAAGITSGCATDPPTYCPEATITRAQMAVFLLRGIHGSSYSPPALGGDSGFVDVPPDHWAAAWIKQLAAEGITGGCGNGKYCPEYPVTRDQMAVFLLRSKYGASYSPPPVGTSTGLGDVPANHWAAAWIKQLIAEGITAGCGNGNYCPSSPVTRAQMAVFLVRTFNLP